MRKLLLGAGFVESGFIDHLDPGDPEIIYVRLRRKARDRERGSGLFAGDQVALLGRVSGLAVLTPSVQPCAHIGSS
ncbi:hypothetical protein ACU4GD_31625 [Cupriavidus basilensis]